MTLPWRQSHEYLAKKTDPVRGPIYLLEQRAVHSENGMRRSTFSHAATSWRTFGCSKLYRKR